MAWAVGSDHAGLTLRRQARAWLEERGEAVQEVGPGPKEPADYPDVAWEVARRVADGRAERAVLCCGTGVGMQMAAGCHCGVRAVVGENSVTVRLAREHNDANVLCLGERTLGALVAVELLAVFYGGVHDPEGRHAQRVRKLEGLKQPGWSVPAPAPSR